MNIFKILSSYDGSIKEPNISSFLAYLLDLNEDHGLAESLLKSVIQEFEELKDLDLNQFDYIDINPEHSVFIGKKRRDIDILIEFYKDKNSEPQYALCIENKITDSSIQKDNQLQEELEGLQEEYKSNDRKTTIYFCFLTLEETDKSKKEFESFKYDEKKKKHLYWKGGNESIQGKIIKILEDERIGEIDPISEESKFLIKSFLTFIRTNFKSRLEEKEAKMERKKYGDKTTREHFFDFVKKLEDNKDYLRNEVRSEFAKYIKEVTGIEINKSHLNCIMYEMVVNEKNRIHYNVTKSNCKQKNIFYYPDENNKNIIRKYSNDLNDIKIYLKDGQEFEE